VIGSVVMGYAELLSDTSLRHNREPLLGALENVQLLLSVLHLPQDSMRGFKKGAKINNGGLLQPTGISHIISKIQEQSKTHPLAKLIHKVHNLGLQELGLHLAPPERLHIKLRNVMKKLGIPSLVRDVLGKHAELPGPRLEPRDASLGNRLALRDEPPIVANRRVLGVEMNHLQLWDC